MSLYPSLEDMKVDQMGRAQQDMQRQAQANAHAIMYGEDAARSAGGAPPPAYGAAQPYPPQEAALAASLYPSLQEYMGLALSPEVLQANMPLVVAHPPQETQLATRFTSTGQGQIAPITGNSMGLQRAEIKHGVKEIVLCKDRDGKIGVRVKSVNKGLFVALVHKDTPAAMAGLRFGDQILQIQGDNVAGWDTDKAMKYLKNCPPDKITLAIRERPFERTVTLQKDSAGTVGFVFKDNKITALVKDSSAARNGVLIDHHLVEVNGQNVVGLKEKDIKELFDASPRTVTITLIPSFIYDHIVKSMGSSLIKKFMDHSVPDV